MFSHPNHPLSSTNRAPRTPTTTPTTATVGGSALRLCAPPAVSANRALLADCLACPVRATLRIPLHSRLNTEVVLRSLGPTALLNRMIHNRLNG